MEIPDLRTVLRHAVPRFVEGTLIPLALFLIALRVLGVGAAMFAGLAWVYTAITVRLLMRRRVPGILLIGALTLTARTAVALAAHSVVVYFLQPSLATMLVAGAFLLSVPLDKPLAGRLAADFCPLPTEMHSNTHVRRFFRHVSLLWAFAKTANAGLTIWLLFSQSLGTFVVLRSVVSAGVTIAAVIASAIWFKRSMARHGIVVHFPRLRRSAAASA
jgi:intracellular septation protein A